MSWKVWKWDGHYIQGELISSHTTEAAALKKAKKEKIKCLLKKIYDLFKENDNIIPIIKSIEINMKLILSISFHQIFKLK